jgi:hypothetical protein
VTLASGISMSQSATMKQEPKEETSDLPVTLFIKMSLRKNRPKHSPTIFLSKLMQNF